MVEEEAATVGKASNIAVADTAEKVSNHMVAADIVEKDSNLMVAVTAQLYGICPAASSKYPIWAIVIFSMKGVFSTVIVMALLLSALPSV